MRRRIPQSHDAVADEFVDGSAFFMDRLGGERQKLGEERRDIGAMFFGELGEAWQDRRRSR